MLSEASRPYIAASVPVLQQYGLEITKHFYASMFKAHPELKNLFNMGNQASGVQQQSLAAAVFAYAANIDNAAALQPVIERISHKHAAVGIKSAHYPIVGRHLLGAIAHVLGESATPELIQAWDEAYWLLAGQLIAAEACLYQSQQVQAGEMQLLNVIKVEQETEEIISVYLQTDIGQSPGRFKPGQYVSVAAQFSEHSEIQRQLRQYSLSDSPEKPWWRLTIKREDTQPNKPAGQVSNWLHTQLRVGGQLEVSAAFGDFAPHLKKSEPIVLISAGVGITPMQSILNALVEQHSTRPITFIYAARSRQHQPFARELSEMKQKLPQLVLHCVYENEQGRISVDHFRDIPRNAECYLCGPLMFMRAQWQLLLQRGIPETNIHREVFGPELLDHPLH